MIPDAEKLVSNYLRNHFDVAALAARVVGKTPATTTTAWVRVTQLAANADLDSRADHLVNFMVQLDCYAGSTGGQPEANLLARTVREALHEMPDETFVDAVVSSARFVGMLRLPDQDFEPARERVVLTAQVYAHAVVAV